jgi:hypothetical protein
MRRPCDDPSRGVLWSVHCTCLKAAIAQGRSARVIRHDDLELFGSSQNDCDIPTYEHHQIVVSTTAEIRQGRRSARL